MDSNNRIWTIGHSTRSADEFLALLLGNEIQHLIDVRSFPGSRRYPHFNKETLAAFLEEHGIGYSHMPGLGGRRKPDVNSLNTAWRHPAFRGYADHMGSEEFQHQIASLEKLAREKRTVYMCSEGPWWKCHRSLISDYLKVRGWDVLHIIGKGEPKVHPFTSPARAEQGELFYSEPQPRETDE